MSRSHDDQDDDYFNDLSQQLHLESTGRSRPSVDRTPSNDGNVDADGIPKPKRIACVLCRKRKLRCDGQRPSCGTCARLAHECAYDEVRRKSGPKRGYVKALEARLGAFRSLGRWGKIFTALHIRNQKLTVCSHLIQPKLRPCSRPRRVSTATGTCRMHLLLLLPVISPPLRLTSTPA